MPIKQLLVRESDSLDAALSLLDRNGFGMAFAVDADGRLVGRLGAADIEACLARGGNLSLNVRAAMTPDAGTLSVSATTTLPAPGVDGGKVVALVDAERRPVDVATAGRPRRIPVAEPVLGGNELKYVTDCINTNWISSQGTYVRRFEEMLGERLGTAHVISASNGTAALHLALLGYGIGAGDEVIVPDLTFAATINTVIHAGATPVIVDVDRRTWNIDPALVAAAITPRTRAIMPVHLYGLPADMDPLMALAEKHGLVVIEDAAEAIGARYKGKPCGTIGHAGTFSFFSNKVITTGEGGAVVLRDAEAAALARRLRDHGMDPTRRYWHNEVGYNYRLTNLQAAIGCAQLEQADGFLSRKRAIAARYRKGLVGAAGLDMAAQIDGYDNSYWMVSVIVDAERTGLPRDEIMKRLGDAGIDSRPLFYPLHEMPPYRPFAGNRAFPATDELSAQGFSLPSGVGLGDDEIDYICATLQRIAGARRLTRRTQGS